MHPDISLFSIIELLYETYIQYFHFESSFKNYLLLFGLIFIILRVLTYLPDLLKCFIPAKDIAKRYGEKSYALITGASDGIGKGFAFSLAKRGFNLVIIARNKDKLNSVAKDIKSLYPETLIKAISIDFKKAFEDGFFDKIQNEIQGLDISILVNNVGFDLVKHFTDIPEGILKELITVNCLPQTILTRKLIPRFLKRKNHKSAIINVASTAGTFPLAYFQAYSSTKAYNDFFSRALAQEYPNIDILTLRPGYVSTQLNFRKKPDLMTLTVEDCVESCLRNLGIRKITYGHWRHAINGYFVLWTPEWLLSLLWINFLGEKLIKERSQGHEVVQK